MKFRSTALLLLVALGVAAYIWFVEVRRPSTKEARDQGQMVAQIDRDQIDSISIKNSETTIELRKHANNVWYLEAPVKDRADSMALNQLFTTAESLRHQAVIGTKSKGAPKSQLKEVGLSNSETRIKFTGSQKPVELLIGKDAAVEGKVYVRREDSNVVYVIGNDLKTQITKAPDEFRDRRLTELSPGQVHRLIIKTAAGEIEVEKKNEHWSLIRPLKARGADSIIGDLISQAATARIDKFVADTANLAAYGLQEPRGTISLFSEASKEPVVLQLGTNPGDAKETKQTYARLSTRDSVLLLPKAIEQFLATKPNDLRDKDLVRFESDIVDRITIEGTSKIVLARKGEDWVRKGDKEVAVNGTAAGKLLEVLKAQPVTDFVADVASDLPKYGLDQPQAKLTLSSFASENTSETTAGDKPIVTLLFGKIDGDIVYAKLDDEPFIVSVNRSILDQIPQHPIQWQPVTIFQLKPEEITTLEITKPGQPPLSLQRDKDKWKLAKGDGNLNQVHMQSLLNTLAGLRAVRWFGPVLPEHAFETPAVTVSFKTATSQDPITLKIGAPADPSVIPAMASGTEGAFEMSRPDRGAFDLPLVDKPPSPAPAATEPAPQAAPKP